MRPTAATATERLAVTDPNGAPLRGAPSATAGGVFAGDLTNRNAASTHGLTAAALATALTTKSPDATGRAVFLAALADGSVVQVHVQRGVDGLVGARLVHPHPRYQPRTRRIERPGCRHQGRDALQLGAATERIRQRPAGQSHPRVRSHRRWNAAAGGECALHHVARAARRQSTSRRRFARSAARNFSSNTTLGGGSDLYVLNRGNNSIVRMTQAGSVVAVRHIESSVEGFRLNGIAVSENARTHLDDGDGARWSGDRAADIRVRSRSASRPRMIDHARSAGAHSAAKQGADIFSHDLTPADGLGPLFNGTSCASCHNIPVRRRHGRRCRQLRHPHRPDQGRPVRTTVESRRSDRAGAIDYGIRRARAASRPASRPQATLHRGAAR